MKKSLIIIFVLIIFFLNPTISYPGFLIKLKNNRTIYTEHYLIEGDKIILYLKSGTVKFSKDEIQSISETKSDPAEDRAEDKKEAKKEEKKGDKKDIPKTPEKTLDQKKIDKDLVIGEKEIENYKNKKKETQKRLDEAKEAYFNASSKDEKSKAEKIMLSISKEIHELQEEVRQRNKGSIPKWWQEE